MPFMVGAGCRVMAGREGMYERLGWWKPWLQRHKWGRKGLHAGWLGRA